MFAATRRPRPSPPAPRHSSPVASASAWGQWDRAPSTFSTVCTTPRSRAPLLAICGQVPREDVGSDFFQEVANDAVFADVAVFNQTVVSIDQLPGLIEQAGNSALAERGVAVLTLPGDVGGLELPRKTQVPRFVDERRHAGPDDEALRRAAAAINAAGSVALLVGIGFRCPPRSSGGPRR